jgi:hypothetical protein
MKANFTPYIENLLRRVDGGLALHPEASVQDPDAADIRQRKDQWDDADSTAGLELRDDGSVGLDPSNTTILTTTGNDGYWRSIDPRHQRKDLQVLSITRVAGVATVTVESLNGFIPVTVLIAGANEAAYNGTQTVTGFPSGTSFTFNVGGAPATPATGVLTCTVILTAAGTDGGIFRCAKLELNGAEDFDVPILNVRTYLTPDAGGLGSSDVRWYECHIVHAARAPNVGFVGFVLSDICDPVRVLAPAVAGDVPFDFTAIRPKPKKRSALGEGYRTYVIIYALNASGGLAHNVGWARDSTNPDEEDTPDNVLTGIEVEEVAGLPGVWVETDLVMCPAIRVQMGSYAAATLTFDAVPLDLGATPTGTVEFVGEGRVPTGCSITYEVSDDSGGSWTPYVDGDDAATLGLALQQNYSIRATLDPGPDGSSTPELLRLGAREILRFPFAHLATVDGDQGMMEEDDVQTLRVAMGQVRIKAITDGVRDYQSAIEDLFASYFTGDIEWRIWLGHKSPTNDEMAAHRFPNGEPWPLIDTYITEDYKNVGGAIEVQCLSPLAFLSQAVPVFNEATDERDPIDYTNETIRSVVDSLLDDHLGLEAFRCGARPEDTTTRVTRRIEQSEAKALLDGLAFLTDPGGAFISSQGRLSFKSFLDEKASVARIPMEEITWGDIGPGHRRSLPEFYVQYDYDQTAGEFLYEARGFHADAITRLGKRRLDPPTFLDEDIARWIRSVGVVSITSAAGVATVTTDDDHGMSDGDFMAILGANQDEYNIDEQVTVTGVDTFTYPITGAPASPATGTITCSILAHRIAFRTTKLLGPGLKLWSADLEYAHPEFEMGDLIEMETDRFVERDPTQDARSIRGRCWVRAVVAGIRDLWGKKLWVLVRSPSDIIPESQQVTRQLSTGVRCKAYRTADQVVAASTTPVITWDAEVYDQGNLHSVVSGTDAFTISVKGTYTITVRGQYSGRSGTTSVAIYKNAVPIQTESFLGASIAGSFTLSVTDEAEVGDSYSAVAEAAALSGITLVGGSEDDSSMSVVQLGGVARQRFSGLVLA